MEESSDDFDNNCPLCLEEMDVTDRHLKPCQCGYQICVWCWHQVIEMAAKQNTEGRCPACRTAYDKDKVVGTRISTAELEFTVDKRKSHKSKKQEGRRHLCNIRVVQRNLVYIVGFPIHLADEETLERREYLGQYGKILKVAVSRQHSHNGLSAGVYVTFVKEEDAARCIRSLDGCLFEGKALRACFGTNKYCNAWLKNMPCNNPECLYLHDEGADEDSYTKEEMMTKNQFNDLTRPPHRAFGGLPPPVFEASTSVSQSQQAPTPSKVAVQRPTTCSGASKVTNLPPAAAWGMRGTAAKSVVKTPQVKKKLHGSAGGGAEKPDVAGKDLDEFELTNNVAASEQNDYCLGDSDHTDLKADTQTDSSQGSSSPENHGYGLHHQSGEHTEVSSNERQVLHVGDLSISLNSDISALRSEVLSSEAAERSFTGRDESEDVISALERIDLSGEVSEAGMSSSAVPDPKWQDNQPAESNIIADILTMDFNSGEGPLSPGDLTKLFLKGKSPVSKQSEDYLESPLPWKSKQQSRFAFARQDEGCDHPTGNQNVLFSDDGASSKDLLTRSVSLQSSTDSGHNAVMKSRLFAPPGFSGTSVPPPGFAIRSSSSVPPSPAGSRLTDFDLLDPAIMAVGRGQLQNELAARTMRGQAKSDLRQLHDPDGLLSLELMQQQQQQPGFLEFGNLIKHQQQQQQQHQQQQQQQQQQQRSHEPRKVSLKYPMAASTDDFSSILHGDVGSLARVSGQYEGSYLPPYSPGSTRNFRSMSSLDNGWAAGYGGENLAKFKRGLGSGISNSLRPGDGNSAYFPNGNQALSSLEHYIGDADIQGAFV